MIGDVKMSDQYQWWREALAGNSPEIHADVPQSGFYKMRQSKDGPYLPVAIWMGDDGQKCRVANDVRDAEKVWTFCAGNPVSKSDAKHAFEKGTWPGDVLSNSAQMTLAEEIEDAATVALDWLKASGITDKVSMDTAANHRAKLQELSKKADTERESKVRPHLDAQKTINGAYKPLVEKADSAAKTLRDALSKYMAAEEDKARKAAAEAARIENEKRMAEYKHQQELAAKAAAEAKANEPPPPPVEAPVFIAPEPVKLQAGGQRGKKAGLREITRYSLSDYAAALAHVKDHPDVMAAVEKVAFAQARAGATVPGVSSFIEKVAV